MRVPSGAANTLGAASRLRRSDMRHYYPILVGVLLFLIPGETMARRDAATLYDATDGSWDLPGLAAEFRAAGASVRVKHGKHQSCTDAKKGAPDGTVAVCEKDLPYAIYGMTTFIGKDAVVTKLDPETSSRRQTACHEMMHIVTNIPDRVSGSPRDDSCVWGYLDHLGAFDLAYIADRH